MHFSAIERDQTSSTQVPEFQQLTRFICIGVLLVGIIDAFSGSPPVSIFLIHPTYRFAFFCLSIISLLILEWILPAERGADSNDLNNNWAIFYLTGLLTLSGFAVLIWDYRYTVLLFSVAILFARLYFNQHTAYLTITISFIILFIRLAFGPRRNFISPDDLEALLTFGLIVLLVSLMARLIKREQHQRSDLEQLHQELQASHLQLQETSGQLAEMAVLNERNRLARDIHDGVGHHLTAVGIQLEIASQLQSSNPSTALNAISEAKQAARDALADVRQSVHALRQTDNRFELKEAVDLLVKRIANESLTVSLKLDGEQDSLPEPIRYTLFRAIQEGLTNITKHAQASRVNIWLQIGESESRLRIIDDGQGFDTAQKAIGSGLAGLRERIATLNGTLQIDSRLGEGTVIDIAVPNV